MRNRLLNTSEKGYAQTSKLQDASRVAYEAEQIAGSTALNLRSQRDRILYGMDEVSRSSYLYEF